MNNNLNNLKKGQVYRGALRTNLPLLPSGPGGVGLDLIARDLTRMQNYTFFWGITNFLFFQFH